MDDRHHVARAVALAEQSVRDGGGPFGAVVVRDGAVLAEGRNQVVPERDPTAHAEVVAIRAAARAAGSHDLSGATLYASCEPCPMCLGAILWARLERVVFAVDRHVAARAGFDDRAFHEELARPPEERLLPLVQLLVEGAERPFTLWRASDSPRY